MSSDLRARLVLLDWEFVDSLLEQQDRLRDQISRIAGDIRLAIGRAADHAHGTTHQPDNCISCKKVKLQ